MGDIEKSSEALRRAAEETAGELEVLRNELVALNATADQVMAYGRTVREKYADLLRRDIAAYGKALGTMMAIRRLQECGAESLAVCVTSFLEQDVRNVPDDDLPRLK